jgi:hypothetical protein
MGFSSSDFWVLKISTRFAAYSLSVGVVFHWYLWRFFSGNATHRLAKHTTNRGNMAYPQTTIRQIQTLDYEYVLKNTKLGCGPLDKSERKITKNKSQ